MGIGFVVALTGIYGLLAIPFRSYIQPIIIMLSIPFGVILAIIPTAYVILEDVLYSFHSIKEKFTREEDIYGRSSTSSLPLVDHHNQDTCHQAEYKEGSAA